MGQKNRKADAVGITTSVTPLGNGRWGARVFKNGKLIEEDNTSTSRAQAAKALKELLRWVDKMGHGSPMASASRDRAKK